MSYSNGIQDLDTLHLWQQQQPTTDWLGSLDGWTDFPFDASHQLNTTTDDAAVPRALQHDLATAFVGSSIPGPFVGAFILGRRRSGLSN